MKRLFSKHEEGLDILLKIYFLNDDYRKRGLIFFQSLFNNFHREVYLTKKISWKPYSVFKKTILAKNYLEGRRRIFQKNYIFRIQTKSLLFSEVY